MQQKIVLNPSREGIKSDQVVIEGQEANIFSLAPAPFMTLPAWWRRFLFRLLTPRDLAVYMYICSLLGPKATAFPTLEQIAYELGLSRTDSVVNSIRKLEKLGFLIRAVRELPGRRTATRRTIYQRPAPEFTLLMLLNADEVDGNLFPKGKQQETLTDELDTTANAVGKGLESLLGVDRYKTYQAAANERRRPVLHRLLEARLVERTKKTYHQLIQSLYPHDEHEAYLEGDLRRILGENHSVTQIGKAADGVGRNISVDELRWKCGCVATGNAPGRYRWRPCASAVVPAVSERPAKTKAERTAEASLDGGPGIVLEE